MRDKPRGIATIASSPNERGIERRTFRVSQPHRDRFARHRSHHARISNALRQILSGVQMASLTFCPSTRDARPKRGHHRLRARSSPHDNAHRRERLLERMECASSAGSMPAPVLVSAQSRLRTTRSRGRWRRLGKCRRSRSFGRTSADADDGAIGGPCLVERPSR